MPAIIKYVETDSIAEELGLEPGDTLVEINNTEIKDVLDYRFLINDEFITLKIPLWISLSTAQTSAFSALSTSFLKVCVRAFILKMMTHVFPSFREIT